MCQLVRDYVNSSSSRQDIFLSGNGTNEQTNRSAAYLTSLRRRRLRVTAATVLAKPRELRHPPTCSVAADRWPTSQRLRKL
jgi:hypothetical protein